MTSKSLEKQLDELQLICCSLLPGEVIAFLEEPKIWSNLLKLHASGTAIPEQQGSISPPNIRIRLEGFNVWFEINVPSEYVGQLARSCPPTFSVKGENLSRAQQERWQRIIEDKMVEMEDDAEYPIYQLVSLHLLPLLHAESESIYPQSPDISATSPPTAHQYHALLTSHHLISPNKRRSLQQWSTSLSIAGFAKVGYPGVIYAQGRQDSVEEFVANIKAMQWLALKVRFLEPLTEANETREKSWTEFQKVGEVVEEMRRIGREQFIVEMGIGSAGIK